MENKRFVSRQLSDIEPMSTSHNIGLKQVLLANDETCSAISQIAVTSLREGELVEEHVHKTMDEHYLFQSGKGWLMVDGEEIECKEGLFLLIPAGLPHGMRAEMELRCMTIGVALKIS